MPSCLGTPLMQHNTKGPGMFCSSWQLNRYSISRVSLFAHQLQQETWGSQQDMITVAIPRDWGASGEVAGSVGAWQEQGRWWAQARHTIGTLRRVWGILQWPSSLWELMETRTSDVLVITISIIPFSSCLWGLEHMKAICLWSPNSGCFLSLWGQLFQITYFLSYYSFH